MRISDWSSDVCSSDLELLQAQEVDVCDAALLALVHEVVVDLARAQHDLLGVFRLARPVVAIEPTVEAATRAEGRVVGDAALVAQQLLRRAQDNRIADVPCHPAHPHDVGMAERAY